MHLSEFPAHPVAAHDINLYHTVATVKIPQHFNFGFDFDAEQDDIRFVSDLDHLNFRELPKGTLIARTADGTDIHFEVTDENGNETEREFFLFDRNEIRFAKDIMPSMLTLDERVIRQDCLCYLMERYPFD
jgi:hypothetical protein